MKNSYQGYWFSCQTTYSDDIGTRKWFLLLESKLTKNMRYHRVDLDNQLTLGQVLKIAYIEIEKLNQEEAKQ